MATYDQRAQATAARLLATIAKGGKAQAVTLTSKTAGAYDPATSAAGVTTATQQGSAVVFEYSSWRRAGLRNEPGSLIQAGDKSMLLSPLNPAGAALSPPPKVDDIVTLADGGSYTITTVAPLAPAGLAVYHECNIRGIS